ncbi:zf-HC2 domain-containing protein [Nonomuraea sediminis]|uniref:zf-HC2 domain-containing protein n=1 Tax=Nonomuraea sediminis TaxID=2835864 RepID=UPI001BDC41FA|nr:zf-HC2 domain-containing protein [Nonomuraea sediminis]
MNAQWHVPDELLEHYVSGHLEPVQVLSVESHLTRCERCRAAVPCEEDWLTASWGRVEDLVDRPRPRPVARLLRWFGVPEHVATFLAATPSLARGWLLAVTSVTAFAVVAAHLGRGGVVPFLVVAPVLPLAGVAVAYGPRVDPVHEIQAATPMGGARVLLLRAVAVLVTAIVLAGVAALLLPGPLGLSAAAWLLPALALTAATLALSTRFAPMISAAALTVAWLGGVLLFARLTGDALTPFSPAAQALYGAAALILVPLIYLRRARFDSGEPTWTRP